MRLKASVEWASGGTGERQIWLQKTGGLFYGSGKERDEVANAQGVASAVVDVVAGDHFELAASQSTGSAADIAVGALAYFALEVVE